MEIRHLQYFVEVARQKSFSKASEKCHVSQSTISKLIKDLERELGTSLFNRTSKYVQLTDTGAIFFDQALEVVTLHWFATYYRNYNICRIAGRI